ncbi:MAG: ribosome maturation factor RimM [Clostridia bacterium]|nr:ribosome maturation factor RimM [Clostridia bacterium]
MDYFRIGQIVRPHGVTGALKLLPLTDDVKRFKALSEAYLEQGSDFLPVTASEISVQPDAVFLRLSTCHTCEEAQKLRGVYLCVDRAHAAKLPAGRWFVKDLIGCTVTDTAGNACGTLTDVLETGANDVYVLRRPDKGTLMIPAIKKLLREVDVAHQRIVLDADVLAEVGLYED